MQADYKTKAPELLTDLLIKSAAILKGKGMDEAAALDAAQAIVDQLRIDWGGQNLYMPKGISLEAAIRHSQMYRDFTGNNAQEVADKHGVTLQWAYHIIKKITAQERDRTQPRLFD